MPSKNEWTTNMVAEGARDPDKTDPMHVTVYGETYSNANETIESMWVITDISKNDKYDELHAGYSKARNKFARLLRKDGWEVKCSTQINMWNQEIIALDGVRKRSNQQATLNP